MKGALIAWLPAAARRLVKLASMLEFEADPFIMPSYAALSDPQP